MTGRLLPNKDAMARVSSIRARRYIPRLETAAHRLPPTVLNRPLLTTAVVLVIVALAGCTASGTEGGERPPETRPKAQADAPAGVFGQIPRIVGEVQPSVVTILAPSPRGEGQGSGVIVRRDGLVVTNAHVVERARVVRVAFASGDRAPRR